MSEKIVICVGMTLLLLLIPYGLTMLLTGNKGSNDEKVKSGIYVEYEEEGQQKIIDFEEYMVGVLAAQLPWDYEEEVYKAQAIILRTNARKLAKSGENLKEEDLKLAHNSEQEMKENLGEQRYEEVMQKIHNAIRETQGKVITYDNNYIDALYHQVSMGQTASAIDVYNQNVPYLVSVDSSMDVEAKDYMQTVTYTFEDIVKNLYPKEDNAEEAAMEAEVQNTYGITKENYLNEIQIAEKSQGGYVKNVKTGSQTITGENFKNAFSLNSLYFYIENADNVFRIICLGKGHGLGMSQYGANKMAKEGKTYEDIIYHYYTGVAITDISE